MYIKNFGGENLNFINLLLKLNCLVYNFYKKTSFKTKGNGLCKR